jgi:hypothetical protein
MQLLVRDGMAHMQRQHLHLHARSQCSQPQVHNQCRCKRDTTAHSIAPDR